MAKKLFDLKNTKKVVTVIIIRCIIISLANISLFFVPIDDTNCFDFLGLILEGAIKIDFSSGTRIAYHLITLCMVIGFSFGILFKNKMSEVDTASIFTIKKSAFATIIAYDSIYWMFSCYLGIMYYIIELVLSGGSFMETNSIYLICFAIFEVVLMTLELLCLGILKPARNFISFGSYAQNKTEKSSATSTPTSEQSRKLLNTLSKRYKIYGVLWIIIGIFQILSFWGALAGIWNLYASYTNIKYSKEIKQNPHNIVASHTPVAKSVWLLIFQLVLGSVIGVVGSIYYFVAIRGFVMKNKDAFGAIENLPTNGANTQMHSYINRYCKDNKSEPVTKKASDKKQNLDALVKYKKLYDSGAITQEEFLKKKAELLDE